MCTEDDWSLASYVVSLLMYFIVCYHTLSCQVDYNNSLTTVVFIYDLSVPFSFDFIPQDHPEGVQEYTKTWLQWEGYF